jgi:hypothetical protein
MLRNKCTAFREKKMPVLKTNCHWKAVIYKVVRSVAASLLRLTIKGTTVRILKTYFSWLLPCILIFTYSGVNRFILRILLHQIAALVLSNFSLAFSKFLIVFCMLNVNYFKFVHSVRFYISVHHSVITSTENLCFCTVCN